LVLPFGFEMVRPRERRQPRMPNAASPLVEQRVLAFALGHLGVGPNRIAAELARPKCGRDRRFCETSLVWNDASTRRLYGAFDADRGAVRR
jgi:hypothetical protein